MAGLKLRPHSRVAVTWRCSRDSINAVFCLDATTGLVSLQHGLTDQTIHLTAHPRPFGGVQWFFICPATGARVSTLRKPPGAQHFASRHAWGKRVTYASQSVDPVSRAWRIKHKVASRLSAGSDGAVLPIKPRGMRWATYDALANRYEAADDRLDRALIAAFPAFMASAAVIKNIRVAEHISE